MVSVTGRHGLWACAALTFSATVVAWLPPDPALATEKSVQVQVSAQVVPWARLECQNRPEVLRVALGDVQSGYKELIVRCTVVTNDPRGAIVRLVPQEGLTTSITVDGLSRQLVLELEPAEVWQARDSAFELRVRFNLRKDLVPGSHPVPLLLLAIPVSDSMPSQP